MNQEVMNLFNQQAAPPAFDQIRISIASPEDILATPDDTYMLLGLAEVITPQRVRGLHALLGYMKKQVRNLL